MIKVTLKTRENIDVKLKPRQGIKIDSSNKYLFDPSLVQEYVDLTKDYSDKAMQSEANVKASEMNAELSAEEAKQSETNAKQSELNAKSSEEKAKASEQKAIQEANASAESAYQSQQSALASYQYSSNAEEDAKNTLETLGHVLESESNVTQIEQRVKQSETNAKISEQNAEKAVEDCEYIKNSLGTVYVFRGSVNTVSELPDNAQVGDVYDVQDSGINYAWTGSSWDSLGVNVDLSEYAKKTDLNAKQDKLTSSNAGTGIKIENGVISNTQTSANWGNIKGTLSNQTDLQNALNNKVSKLGNETISGEKIFNNTILRSQPFSGSSAHTIRAVDTNNKGNIIIIPYYTNNTIYLRVQAKNTTANKDAALDVQVKDDGTSYLSYSGSATTKQVNFHNCTNVLVPTPAAGDNSQRAVNTTYLKSVMPTITYLD